MKNPIPIVILFNGPPGVGKTTIAKELAKKSKYGAFTDVDKLRHHVVGGIVRARNQKKDRKEFEKQRLLAADNIACMAKNYIKHGFNYFVSDLVKIPSVLERYKDNFKNVNFYHIILNAEAKELVKRDANRPGLKLHGKQVIERIKEEMNKLDLSEWVEVDTTNKNIQETIDYVLK